MAKTPRKSPGVGRDGTDNLGSQAAYRAALAMETLDKETIAAATEVRKRHRKGYEKNGVVLADLDDVYKMKDMAFSEIVLWFKRKFNALGAVFDLGTQFDLFSPAKGAKADRAAFKQMGMMAAINGKEDEPPPGLAPEEMKLWEEGYDEGHAARLEAMRERMEEHNAAKEKADQAAKAANQPPPEDDDDSDRDPPDEDLKPTVN